MCIARWISFFVSLVWWPAAGQSVGAASNQLLTRSGIPAAYPPEKDVSPPVEHLLGDLGGIRTNLEGHGIYLLLDATTEFAGNVSGGVKRGSTFANQVGLEADIDWQRLAGLVGLSTHVIIVNRSGSSDSHLFGDDFLPVQEIYGSGGDVAIHLVSAYAEESLFGRRLDVAVDRRQPAPVGDDGARRVVGQQVRRPVEVGDLASDRRVHVPACGNLRIEESELQAGRAGIKDKDRAGHQAGDVVYLFMRAAAGAGGVTAAAFGLGARPMPNASAK